MSVSNRLKIDENRLSRRIKKLSLELRNSFSKNDLNKFNIQKKAAEIADRPPIERKEA